MTINIERLGALESPAVYIHRMMSDLGYPSKYTWQEIDQGLRKYYCADSQMIITRLAQEIEDLKDKLHILQNDS